MKNKVLLVIIGLMVLVGKGLQADPFSQINPGYVSQSLTKPNAQPFIQKYRITLAKINEGYAERKRQINQLPFYKRVAIGYMIQMPIVIIAALLL